MEIKKFIEDFANQFDETDPAEFKGETVFRELEEWSSLIAMVDEEYDVRIKGDDIRSVSTIEDLYNLVVSRK